ncbi:MAG: hypothetical protein LBL83_01355, partial [Clostridiales bacterium]|nr:hypothetical protein [Clostridiales bacterium]
SDEIGRFAHPKVSILENGPLRARIRVEQSWGESLLRQDYSLLAGAKRIDVSVRMDVRMAHRQIKMCFPLAARGAVPVYSMPYGFIEKSADGLEEPSQQWVAAACAGKPAFALINDGKYSFSMKGGALRMVAVRTPGYADHFGERDGQMEYTDQGISEFRYSMLPCCGSYAEIVREARLLNQPPEFVVETYHEGALPASWSGIGISSPNVIAEALKRSEADDGYVLRLFEAAGEPAAGVCVDCPAAGRSFACSFGPQEIKTVLLPDDAAAPVAELLITELGAYGGGEL